MTISLRFLAIFAILLGLLGAIMFSMGRMIANNEALAKSETSRMVSLRLGDQLRQSSDDLTRMVRTYAITGDGKYEKYFYEILAIRDGKSPRPQNYDEIYWDFVIATGKRSSNFDPPVALLDLIKSAGVSNQELQKLQTAKKNSDELTKLEKIAFKAMKGLFANGSGEFTIQRPPDPEFARKILHGEEYHGAKAQIMNPIGDFLRLLNERTLRDVSTLRTTNAFHQRIVFALISVTVLFSGFAYLHLRRRIIHPIISLSKIVERMGKGELNERATVSTSDEIGILATTFNHMIDRTREAIGSLEDENAERRRAERALGKARDEMELKVEERTAALSESEARLSKAAEMAEIGYWIWDEVEDKAIYYSVDMAKIFGVASGSDLAAMFSSREALFAWIHPEDRERYGEADSMALESKRTLDIEYRIINAAGEIRHLHEIIEPVLDERGEIIRSNGISQNITEQKRAEEQLRQAQKMEAVGQLTAGVAHDFNNMLAVISGNAELLEDELGKDNPLLAAVHRATKRAAGLTQRLLAFSRKQMLSPEIVNANDLISDTTGLLHRTLEEHIDIETVTGAGLWNCEVDPAQLENALVNLAINARDAMPDGGKLTIETANARLDDTYAATQADVTPGQYVMLAVTDTGSGMPPEVRERAFEPFFTTKAVGAGSGLGLSMVYGFVKQSGGHVAIYSEQGEGTTIKLYLPRSTETAAVERKAVTEEAPVARGETVLVVVDDPDVRTLAVALLTSLGYQVMEAGTAAAALELLGSTTGINLLLTDVVLAGGMNGRELAAEFERRLPGIKILYMSGYTENATVHHGRLDAGAELLQKPFRRADLARVVRKALDRPSA